MSKPIIHFAHANGFPARTYTKLLKFLEKDFEISFIERLGHNPKFPVTDNWHYLKDELCEFIQEKHSVPVIGIGHSLGGVLHFLAACEKPHLYRQIILLDSPIISRLSSQGLRILKLTKLIDRYSPSQITRFRRNYWRTKDEAYQHFKEKPKFKAFDDDVLRDYINFGTIANHQGFELFIKPHIEAKIYRTIPHHLPRLRGKTNLPISYIGGTDSREGKLARLTFMKKYFLTHFYQIEGSHLFPLEKPKKTAEIVKQILL